MNLAQKDTLLGMQHFAENMEFTLSATLENKDEMKTITKVEAKKMVNIVARLQDILKEMSEMTGQRLEAPTKING